MLNLFGNYTVKKSADQTKESVDNGLVPEQFFRNAIIAWMVFVSCVALVLIPVYVMVLLAKKAIGYSTNFVKKK